MVTSLPSPERRALAEQLLQDSTEGGETSVLVMLRRFGPSTQARLDELFMKSNEGTFTAQERVELTTLVSEYERIMVANTEALLRASRPELFDAAGRLIPSRLTQAVTRMARSSTS
jgi:hypothetical protein